MEENEKIVEKKKRVYIVGCADSRDLTPKNDIEAEYWGVNNLFISLKRPWSRWFEVHNIEFDGKIYTRREDKDFRGTDVKKYLKALAELPCPVYMQKSWDIVPNAIPYPINEITQVFGNYFTNTISYEIALAIYERFEEIHVYGVDMAINSEYYHQRPSCEFFLGWALGLGIKVFVPPEADLLKTRFMYGFEEPKKRAWDKKINGMISAMAARKQAAEAKQQHAFIQIHQYIGAINAAEEIKKIWD